MAKKKVVEAQTSLPIAGATLFDGPSPVNAQNTGEKYLELPLEKLEIVEDRTHPLYDIRSKLPLNQGLVDSILIDGLMVPLVVAPIGDGRYNIVDGRQRYKALVEVNRVLAGRNEPPRSAPCVLSAANNTDGLFAGRISTNEIRTAVDALQRADQIVRMLESGWSLENLARVYGVGAQTIANWAKLAKATVEVKEAAVAGEITVTEAQRLAGRPAEEQNNELLDAKLSGEPIKPGKGGESGKPRVRCRSTKEIVALLEHRECMPEMVVGLIEWLLFQRDSLPEDLIDLSLMIGK